MRKKSAVVLASVGLAWCAVGHAATCTLPVTLTNGTLADATQVMSDLNAAANCASAAVTPSGTPAAGSIAVFSGPNAVTSGNLTGDVTTSGSTAATLAATGVAAGSYTNANITVDSKGRILLATNGSSGTGSNGATAPVVDGLPVGRPLVSAFTQRNIGTATIVDHANGPITLNIPAQSGDQIRGIEEAVPTATPYTVTAKIAPFLWASNYFSAGIYLVDSSGKLTVFYVGQPGSNLIVANWPSVTVGGAWSYQTQFAPTQSNWLRITNDGTNFTFYTSLNGADWIKVYAASSTSFLGNITSAGVFGDNNDTNNIGLSSTLSVWSFAVEPGSGTNSHW